MQIVALYYIFFKCNIYRLLSCIHNTEGVINGLYNDHLKFSWKSSLIIIIIGHQDDNYYSTYFSITNNLEVHLQLDHVIGNVLSI